MRTLLGVDEAGRGPLAGPVAVGVVAVEEGFDVAKEFPGVADSKALSEGKREKLFAALRDRVKLGDIRYTVEFSTAGDIDRLGISRAVELALYKGVRALAPEPDNVHVYLDGSLHAPPEYEQETIIGGDASVPLISLASIAAKVTRDRLMKQFANRYPEYGFEKHKGYGTAAHYAALRTYGLSDIHRNSFIHLDEKHHEAEI